MDTLDKKIIIYDGIYNLKEIGMKDMIAYTSLKTKSSSAMPKEEFNKYVYIGHYYKRPLYMRR